MEGATCEQAQRSLKQVLLSAKMYTVDGINQITAVVV